MAVSSSRVARLALMSAIVTAVGAGCAAQYESAMGRDIAAARQGLLATETAPRVDPEELVEDGEGPEGYVVYALRAHPELHAAYERWRAMTLRISRARQLPEPVVSYGFFVQSVETRVGPQRHRLSVRQSFPWPTKLTAGADAVALRARALQRRFDARALIVRARVEEHYWHLWTVREVRAVRREQAVILGDLSAGVRGRLEVGAVQLADLQQIDVARARLDDTIEALDEEERQATARLVDAIGAPVDSVAPTSSRPPSIAAVGEGEEALRDAVHAHPAIESFAHLAAASEADAASVEADRFPSFMLGVDWIETGEAQAAVPGSGTDAVIASVGVRIPLWQPAYDDTQRAAEADASAHRADGRTATNSALAQLAVTLSAVRDSHRRVRLHRDTLIPQALSAYESVLGAYSAGRGNVAAALLAQRDLLELREALVRAESEHARAWARLDAVVGHRVQRASQRSGAPRAESAAAGEDDGD
ncbi:MAG: TolC family protein [Sandaracinaceae bacterium]